MGNPMGGAPGDQGQNSQVDPILMKQAQMLGINPDDLQRKTRANGLAQLAASLGQGQPLGAGLSQGVLAMQGAGDQVYGQEIQRAQAAKDVERKDSIQKMMDQAAAIAADPNSSPEDVKRAYAQVAIAMGQLGPAANVVDSMGKAAPAPKGPANEYQLALAAAGGDSAKAYQMVQDARAKRASGGLGAGLASLGSSLRDALITKSNATKTGEKTAEVDSNSFEAAVKAADASTQLEDDINRHVNTLGDTPPQDEWATWLQNRGRNAPIVGPMLGGMVDTPELARRNAAKNDELDIIAKYTPIFKPFSDTDTKNVFARIPSQANTPAERQFAADSFKLLGQRERNIVAAVRQKYPKGAPSEVTGEIPSIRQQNAVAPILDMMYPNGPGKPRVMTAEQAIDRLKRMREAAAQLNATPVQ